MHRIQLAVAVCALFLSRQLGAATYYSGGHLSLGDNTGKTAVFISSFAATSAAKAVVVLSSRTVPTGKTFYLQHIDIWGTLSAPSSSTSLSLGTITIFQGNGAQVVIASTTFMNTAEPAQPWRIDLAEPMPFAASVTIASSATANTATSVTWSTHFWGYDR